MAHAWIPMGERQPGSAADRAPVVTPHWTQQTAHSDIPSSDGASRIAQTVIFNTAYCYSRWQPCRIP